MAANSLQKSREYFTSAEQNFCSQRTGDSIALATSPAEVDAILRDAWCDHTHGLLTESEMEALDEAARARREAIRARRTETRPKPRQARSGASAGSLRPPGKREKMFGEGRAIPLDRNAKARIMVLARALKRPTEPGKHYGLLTAKFIDVLTALLWIFHNRQSGRCFPSHETIAAKAAVGMDTVSRAIAALEKAGILSWCNRLTRVVVGGITKVVRTSNAYWFVDPGSKSEFKPGPRNSVEKERNNDAPEGAEGYFRSEVREASGLARKQEGAFP